ncbi:hypothetical protein EKO27_g8584 [Xylaria grammica]|uniref:Uncharacterized protein n=1 Tax=Xylaria grammica TaxID=363999 RepID=A0A439CWE4_9PEZI|nr:hypothetical protein EKO27_g8584 [Xylaria grammica]
MHGTNYCIEYVQYGERGGPSIDDPDTWRLARKGIHTKVLVMRGEMERQVYRSFLADSWTTRSWRHVRQRGIQIDGQSHADQHPFHHLISALTLASHSFHELITFPVHSFKQSSSETPPYKAMRFSTHGSVAMAMVASVATATPHGGLLDLGSSSSSDGLLGLGSSGKGLDLSKPVHAGVDLYADLSGKVLVAGLLADVIVAPVAEVAAGAKVAVVCEDCHVKGAIDASISLEKVVPALSLSLKDIEVLLDLDVHIGAAATIAVNLVTPAKISLPLPGLKVEALVHLDLILGVHTELDLSAGIYVSLPEASLETDILSGNILDVDFSGVAVKVLPIKVRIGCTELLADLRLRVDLAVAAAVDVDEILPLNQLLPGLDIPAIGAGLELAVFANLLEYVGLFCAAPECPLAKEVYGLNVGAAVELGVAVENLLSIHLAPTVATAVLSIPTNTICIPSYTASPPPYTGTPTPSGGYSTGISTGIPTSSFPNFPTGEPTSSGPGGEPTSSGPGSSSGVPTSSGPGSSSGVPTSSGPGSEPTSSGPASTGVPTSSGPGSEPTSSGPGSSSGIPSSSFPGSSSGVPTSSGPGGEPTQSSPNGEPTSSFPGGEPTESGPGSSGVPSSSFPGSSSGVSTSVGAGPSSTGAVTTPAPGGNDGYVTSTVTSTETYTVTACAVNVPNCPAGYQTSVTLTHTTSYTTVCPAAGATATGTGAESVTPAPAPTSTGGHNIETITKHVTTMVPCDSTTTFVPPTEISTVPYPSDVPTHSASYSAGSSPSTPAGPTGGYTGSVPAGFPTPSYSAGSVTPSSPVGGPSATYPAGGAASSSYPGSEASPSYPAGGASPSYPAGGPSASYPAGAIPPEAHTLATQPVAPRALRTQHPRPTHPALLLPAAATAPSPSGTAPGSYPTGPATAGAGKVGSSVAAVVALMGAVIAL